MYGADNLVGGFDSHTLPPARLPLGSGNGDTTSYEEHLLAWDSRGVDGSGDLDRGVCTDPGAGS